MSNYPTRQANFSRKLAQKILAWSGWKIVGEVPDVPHCVVIGAPHTSNWDGVWGITSVLALDWNMTIMAKHTLFQVPVLSQFLRWANVMPINRTQKGGVVAQMVNYFNVAKQKNQPLWIGLAPEGTRSGTEAWKMGFYHIATQADIPILPVSLDYEKKQMIIFPLFYPTNDEQADLAKIYTIYQDIHPKNPQNLSKPFRD